MRSLKSIVLGLSLCFTACLPPQQRATDPGQKVIPPLKPKPLTEVVPTDEPSAVFVLDGAPLCFAGSNNYYLTWKSKEMIESVLKNSQKMGLKVMRQWGHLDIGSLDGSVPNVDGTGDKEGVYFQYWDTKTNQPAYNDGPDGLERLDYLIAEAKKYDIRLVLTLVNNWKEFGGMDQYVVWFGKQRHVDFYTDERIKQAYKDYANHLLNRVNSLTGVAYKDDPTIFAWELANEPRIRNYTRFDSGREGWDGETISKWAREMSAYLRSVDEKHLIVVGDEGFFSSGSESFYNGDDGVDHEALLALPDIDYGTFHLYPDHWGTGLRWADGWIEDHIVAARKAGKPTVLEEYGALVKRDDAGKITWGWERRERVYTQWNRLMLERGGTGIMYWMQAGYDDYKKQNYTDYDGFTVYDPDTDETAKLLQQFTLPYQQKSRACQLAKGVVAKRQVPPGFVTTSAPAGVAAPAARLSSSGWRVAARL